MVHGALGSRTNLVDACRFALPHKESIIQTPFAKHLHYKILPILSVFGECHIYMKCLSL